MKMRVILSEALKSLSRKAVGELYHYTTTRALLAVVRNNEFELATGRAQEIEEVSQFGKSFFMSLTRSRLGGYHQSKTSGVMVTLDGDKLSDRYVIKAVDYYNKRGEFGNEYTTKMQEYEERLVSDKNKIPNALKYIKRVDFIVPSSDMQKHYGSSNMKLDSDVEQSQRRDLDSLGSIILQLKKHKIPYAFYSNTEDWTKKRGEFSLTVKTPVAKSMKGMRSMYGSKFAYDELVAMTVFLSDVKVEDYAPKVREYMASFCRETRPTLNTFTQYRKPDAPETFKQIVAKITRMMKRRHISTTKQYVDYVKAKYQEAESRENMKRAINFCDRAAVDLNDALRNPVGEWTELTKKTLLKPEKYIDLIDNYVDSNLLFYTRSLANKNLELPLSVENLLKEYSINPNRLTSYNPDAISKLTNPIKEKLYAYYQQRVTV